MLSKFLISTFVLTFGVNVWGMGDFDKESSRGKLRIMVPAAEVNAGEGAPSALKRTKKFVNLRLDFFQLSSPRELYECGDYNIVGAYIFGICEFNKEEINSIPIENKERDVRSVSIDSGVLHSRKPSLFAVPTLVRSNSYGGNIESYSGSFFERMLSH